MQKLDVASQNRNIAVMSKNTPNSGDVARLAKVSQSSVSRTFAPGGMVHPKTRAKVLKAAEELGYRPNALARAMISGRSRLIALAVGYLDNQFYPIVLEKLSRALGEKDYQVLLFMTDMARQDETVQKILQYQVEGIIMASVSMSSVLATECAKTGIPVVMFNRYAPDLPVSTVTTDNIEGGRALAALLAEAGHKRIAYVAGSEDTSTNRDREAGFYKGLAEHGMTVWARRVGNYNFEQAAKAARDLFASKEQPDAVFVANDHMAFAVMDVIRYELNLRIPEDVSVVAYDDVPEASWKAYNLTTVSQSSDDMIEATVTMMLEQIENRFVSKRSTVIPVDIKIRNSARLPKGFKRGL